MTKPIDLQTELEECQLRRTMTENKMERLEADAKEATVEIARLNNELRKAKKLLGDIMAALHGNGDIEDFL